jgi:hypothetical protein
MVEVGKRVSLPIMTGLCTFLKSTSTETIRYALQMSWASKLKKRYMGLEKPEIDGHGRGRGDGSWVSQQIVTQ